MLICPGGTSGAPAEPVVAWAAGAATPVASTPAPSAPTVRSALRRESRVAPRDWANAASPLKPKHIVLNSFVLRLRRTEGRVECRVRWVEELIAHEAERFRGAAQAVHARVLPLDGD